MPVTIPVIDDRRYQDLLNETLARIPVHNPEWTNFSRSDPGVTLVELFSFLTENLLYRANQIPERNRRKFLTLLGVPLQAGAAARGLVAFINDRGPEPETVTLSEGLEVRAGEVPFRTTQTIDVLPIEARLFVKRERTDATEALKEYYRQLYASYRDEPAPLDLKLYDTVAFAAEDKSVVDLADTVDRSLWIALLARAGDMNVVTSPVTKAREAIAGKTLSLGVVPELAQGSRDLRAGGATPERLSQIEYSIPTGGALDASRLPKYRQLVPIPSGDVLLVPGVVQLTLPAVPELGMWTNLDPLEPGVGDFPPAIEDTVLEGRVITWLRVRPPGAGTARFLWAGINTAPVVQRARIINELLPDGTGEPDQIVTLANTPVIPGSVSLSVDGTTDPWREIDDLFAAGPEVPSPDPRTPPSDVRAVQGPTDVFLLDSESGQIRFGDGIHGRRPRAEARLRATYEYSKADLGNVGERSINALTTQVSGIKVMNPVRTWGGSRAETGEAGEKQISHYVQHRDRLVTAADFKVITGRTPGIDIGRVDVLPAYAPVAGTDEPGGAPGAVTLLVIPRFDREHPAAPRPDPLFLDAICKHLDPRRLVTTEVFLRGPDYQPIWISIGIKSMGGVDPPKVREAVRRELLDFLSPLRVDRPASGQRAVEAWPLRKSVVDRELMAVASRVEGVMLVTNVLVAQGARDATPEIPLRGLQLPQVMGISVVEGDPIDLAMLRGAETPEPDRPPTTFVPVPLVPEEC
jgi:hypothetical protein